jgi:signal peptidase II
VSRRWTRADTLKWFVAAAVAAAAFFLDLVSKLLVRGGMAVGERIDFLPFFYLERTVNRGVAFGLISGGGWFIIVANLVAMSAVLVYVWVDDRPVLAGLAGGMLFGGSLGNLVERLTRGEVTDFFKFPHYPNFNVADIFILAGAVMVAVNLLRGWRSGPPGGEPG